MAPPLVLGLQMSVCNLEFSVYYGHQLCCGPLTPCAGPVPELIGGALGSQTCWLVQAVPAQNLWTNGNCVGDLGCNFSLGKVANLWPELIWSGQDFLLNEKVRATSFILLLGVGSFVCYRIFHHLRGRLGKRKHPITGCPKKLSRKRGLGFYDELCTDISDDSSELSSISDLSSSNSSCCDRESTSESFSFSDGNENLRMGLTTSNPYEPVHYSKSNGVAFIKTTPGQPRDIVNKDVARLRPARKRQLLSSGDWTSGILDDKENDFERSGSMIDSDAFLDSLPFDENGLNSFQSQDNMSLKGNFSLGSLNERMLKAEELMSQNHDSISSSNSQRPSSLRVASRALKREYSTDSFSCRSDPKGDWSASRTISIDSQVSELAPELQQEAQEIGCVAVERIENLETELNDLKQTVIDLDAEFVHLKVYKRPPERCWELTNISLSDSQSPQVEKAKDKSISSGLLDVVEHHKTKMWYKGLLDNKHLKDLENQISHSVEGNEIRWDLVSRKLLDWDVEEEENAIDSGSDFGNSLETDSVEFEESSSAATAPPISLEWDGDGISEVDNLGVVVPLGNNNIKSPESSSSDSVKRKLRKRRKTLVRKFSSSENSAHSTVNRTRSNSCASDLLANQIVKAIETRNWDYSPMSQSSLGTNNPGSVSMVECLREEDETKGEKILNSEMEINEARNIMEIDSNGNNTREYSTGLPEKNALRDSAYYDGSDFADMTLTEFFEEPVSLSSLVANCQENFAKGLDVLAKNMEVKLARRVRNDHYCPIRATVFQLLSKGHSLLQGHGDGATSIYQILTSAAHGTAPWLLQWSFGRNLPFAGESCLKGFWECLKSLEEIEESLKTIVDKENYILTALKNNSDLDAKLNEAAKLLMVISSLRLYESLTENNMLVDSENSEVRMFSMLLYGRESSRSPKELIMDNLDKIGHTISLDQINLHLLGISLSATIKVARPHLLDTPEFIQACPDWKSNVWPEVLLATDEQNVWLLKR